MTDPRDFGSAIRKFLGPMETITLDWLIICMNCGVGYVGEPFSMKFWR